MSFRVRLTRAAEYDLIRLAAFLEEFSSETADKGRSLLQRPSRPWRICRNG